MNASNALRDGRQWSWPSGPFCALIGLVVRIWGGEGVAPYICVLPDTSKVYRRTL